MSINNRLRAKIEKDIKKYKIEISQSINKNKYQMEQIEKVIINRLEDQSNIKDVGHLKRNTESKINEIEKIAQLLKEGKIISDRVVKEIYDLRCTMSFEIDGFTELTESLIRYTGLEDDVRVQNIIEKIVYIKICNEHKIKSLNELVEKKGFLIDLNSVKLCLDDFEKIFYIMSNEVPKIQNILEPKLNELKKEFIEMYEETIQKTTENILLKYKCICNDLEHKCNNTLIS